MKLFSVLVQLEENRLFPKHLLQNEAKGEFPLSRNFLVRASLRSRRLEVVGTKKQRAREKETREGRGSACTEGPRKSFPAASLITW